MDATEKCLHTCPKCSKRLFVGLHLNDRKIRCPACGEVSRCELAPVAEVAPADLPAGSSRDTGEPKSYWESLSFIEALGFQLKHYSAFWIAFIFMSGLLTAAFGKQAAGLGFAVFNCGAMLFGVALRAYEDGPLKASLILSRTPSFGTQAGIGSSAGAAIACTVGLTTWLGPWVEQYTIPTYVLGFIAFLICMGGLGSFAYFAVAYLGMELSAEERSRREENHNLRNSAAYKHQQRNFYILLTAIALGVAFVSNPSEASFREWVLKEPGRQLGNEAAEAVWELFAKPDYLKFFSIQHGNYYFLSVVKMKIRFTDEDVTFVGAFGQWWPWPSDKK